MSPEPIFLRFENISPWHRNFYEVELSLFYPKRLIRRWGRIGTRKPRAIWTVVSDPDELARQVKAITRVRQQHGYQVVAEVSLPAMRASAA